MKLTKGQQVIYKSHGLYTVKGIDRKTIGDKSKDFYVLSSSTKGMTIIIPVDQVEGCGVRPLSKRLEMIKVINMAKRGLVEIPDGAWNVRYRAYMGMIQSGKALDTASVYRCLTYSQKTQDLSFGERKMLDYAKTLLLEEIGAVYGVDEEKALQYLNVKSDF